MFVFDFKSVTIVAGGPAWCGGALCPSDKFSETLVADAMKHHPPALFVHGTQDTVVPISFAQDYSDRLTALKMETKFYTESVAHTWPPQAASVIVDWIEQHEPVSRRNATRRH
eukprot:TRINITY_DN27571_c0_g1_i1.p1 TRINITY_DN27571_c0_g1~~TRINITY_DN27571_c0_g1_i1.p1  ORF type:complete len:113 (+),score=32.31 TRINITY_DN27571_c0_g1_i1:98-436(+)